MKVLQHIFHYHQQRLSDLLTRAQQHVDSEIWLYENGIREWVIMLEGWTKICQDVYQADIFYKWNEIYKGLQESFGEYKHYRDTEKNLRSINTVPAVVKKELIELVNVRKRHLKIGLTTGGWLYDNKVEQMNKEIGHFDWGSDEDVIDRIEMFYSKQIKQFSEQETYHFVDLKNDLRELRHALRWLCIYPHLLLGLFSFSPFSETRNLTRMKRYMADKVEESPFAKLPSLIKRSHQILIDKYCFLSVNWIVDKLGTFYRTGLKELILLEAIKESGMYLKGTDEQNSYRLFGESQPRMDILLSVSSTVTSLYFQEKNIEFLLV